MTSHLLDWLSQNRSLLFFIFVLLFVLSLKVEEHFRLKKNKNKNKKGLEKNGFCSNPREVFNSLFRGLKQGADTINGLKRGYQIKVLAVWPNIDVYWVIENQQNRGISLTVESSDIFVVFGNDSQKETKLFKLQDYKNVLILVGTLIAEFNPFEQEEVK